MMVVLFICCHGVKVEEKTLHFTKNETIDGFIYIWRCIDDLSPRPPSA